MSRMWVLKSRRSSLDRIDGFVVIPLANPRCNDSSISCRFALSTKIFTVYSFFGARYAQDDPARVGYIYRPIVGRVRLQRHRRFGMQLNGRTPSAEARPAIAPTVAQHKAPRHVQTQSRSCGEQHTRLRLAAHTVVDVVVIAAQQIVDEG